MLFSDNIPDKLKEFPNVVSFLRVLDSLQNFKSEIISESLRVDNAGVLMDSKWLLKKLSEFGITDLPIDYPIQIIRLYLLNVDTVCRTRGSKIGIQLYCSLLSLGEVTVDDSGFYSESPILLLDSLSRGYITENNSLNSYQLCENNDALNSEVSLAISIKSRYFNGDYPNEEKLIKAYIEGTINTQLGFSPNKNETFNYESRNDFYFHKLLNKYFI